MNNTYWTDKEIQFLKDNFNYLTYEELEKTLGRSFNAIKHKVQELHLSNRKWSQSDIEWLKNNANQYDKNDLAKRLKRSVRAIEHKLKEYNLNYYNLDYKNQQWSNAEIMFLAENINNMTMLELSKNLNRSENAILSICKQYKIFPIQTNDIKLTKQEEKLLINNYNNLSINALVEMLHIPSEKILAHAKQLKLVKECKVLTNIERFVYNYLKQSNVSFKEQFIIPNTRYVVDFLIEEKYVLEVQGDYWHGNPNIYKIPNEIQLKNISHDKQKKLELLNLGYEVFYIWEEEIKNHNLLPIYRVIGKCTN